MNTKFKQALISGIIGTVAMTLFMMIAPMMGMPKMNPATMLSEMMALPAIVGWIMHFMIGITFAGFYVLLFRPKLRIGNKWLKGLLFGIVVFVFAQIAIGLMGAMMGNMPKPEGSMMLMAIGSILGHLVYGIVVSLLTDQ